MEEFRPSFADRLVLSLINLRQIVPTDFAVLASGGIWLNDEGRKKVIIAYQKRKQEELNHPFLAEKIPLGMFFFAQALLLARFLRGDLDGYPAVFWR
jgi:CRISPR-associated protein Cas1